VREESVIELVIIGFVAGIVCGISPCIIPVLPVILVAGATAPKVTATNSVSRTRPTPGAGHPAPRPAATAGRVATLRAAKIDDVTTPGVPRARWRSQARPVSVVAGLVVSFSLLILAGSEVISALGLPQQFLRDAGIWLLVVIGASFLIPALSTLLERPFARIGARQPNGEAGGFMVGLALGLVFVPCAGPILSAITLAGAKHHVGWTAVSLTVAFGIGVAIPLLIVAVAGGQLTQRTKALRRHATRVRQVSGVIILVMALTIGLNTFSGLQKDLPGYTTVGQTGGQVRKQLAGVEGENHAPKAGVADLAKCSSTATRLINCGKAPNFTGIVSWLNTPGDKPLNLAQLRGKVVLVDFWTYSCINCQRTLPHVEGWYKDYAKDGFVVVGVSTPEFSFEHVVSNVRSQSASLGVRYPVAVDNNYKTWDAYDNEYWPADYLIDAQGDVRHVSFGEGDYSDTESLIRQLLTAAHPSVALPPGTDVANQTPTGELSPETYVGYQEEQYIVNPTLTRDAPAVYHFSSSVPTGALALSGTWTEGAQEATAGSHAALQLGFLASDVYLVMGGSGTVHVSINGRPTKTITVGGAPKLYTLFQASFSTTANVSLSVSPGVEAYDFTFG
jgi:cytochrome c biogenesis protein CcdA/thiol-disulfide isomerase/thioredoxin